MQSITKKSHELTLADRLSRLNFRQVCKLLGEGGEQLIQRGGRYEIDIAENVTLNEDRFQLRFPTATGNGPAGVEVQIRPAADHRDNLHWECTACQIPCEHVGAAFALILEDKMALGLAAAPPERVPIESLGDEQLIAQALQERMERAASEKMVLRSTDANALWTDYTVTSALSGKTYRLALRGWERGQSFCSCPDFRKNTLGTCKHILNALGKLKRRFGTDRAHAPYVPKHIAVYLQYGKELELRLSLPPGLNGTARPIVAPIQDRAINDCKDLLRRIRQLEQQGHPFQIYPDAEEYIQQRLFQENIEAKVAAIRANPGAHPLRKELLKTELLPYQLDGIAFAAGRGRAILADDMGLGKTIQGVGVAEFLAREIDIRKVLVICPASLKSQWEAEIRRFSERDCQQVIGGMELRARQYANGNMPMTGSSPSAITNRFCAISWPSNRSSGT